MTVFLTLWASFYPEILGVFQFDNESYSPVISFFNASQNFDALVKTASLLQLTTREEESFWLSILDK